MLFNSTVFFIFLPIVFILYWFVFNRKLFLQNLLLLVSSYIFYGWWDWRFLLLLMLSSTVDYVVGIALKNTPQDKKRKLILTLSIVFNISLLGFFKYFNFFIDSFSTLLTHLGFQVNPMSLNVILPVGISFYTFQSLSYTIDVYKKRMEPTVNLLTFFAFVSFFPQLVAGPIERAIKMIPQFSKKRSFDLHLATDGMRQILWGFFKKIVIADNCAQYVSRIFENYHHLSGMTLLLGSMLFALQIYCDFSGYSDIAIGTARLFGLTLMRNFAYPYFSRDIAEFWRRWHISLSTWFRDYLYIPLGGSRGNKWSQIRNTFIVFTISGFWHGANWTFVFWGLLNALYFLPLLLAKKNRDNLDVVAQNKIFPTLKEFGGVLLTFLLVCVAWVFFRSKSLTDAFEYLFRMQGWLFVKPLEALKIIETPILYSILILFILEWLQRRRQHALELAKLPIILRWLTYLAIVLFIFFYGNFSKTEFIYFAF